MKVGQLFYKVDDDLLLVVLTTEVEQLLNKLYEQLGDIGRGCFFNFIKTRYLGVSRRRVYEFLSNKELHQLSRRVRKQKVSCPIVTSKPMEHWQADLVDVSKYTSLANRHVTFLLTVVDCFSKYV